MPDLNNLSEAIKTGKRDDAVELTRAAIGENVPAQDILEAMVAAMDDGGHRFQCNEIFVPAMLVAVRPMKESMAALEPVMVEAGVKPIGTAVIVTVPGEQHDTC